MAKTTVGSLAAILTTNSASFKAGMQSAARTASTTARQISSPFSAAAGVLTSSYAKIAAAITGVVSVGATVALVKSSQSAIDVTAKLSDRLGIQTEKLIGLRHAADLAGVGNEEFDSVLEKMTKNIGRAAIEGGTTAKTLESIGLSAQTLASMSPDETFLAVADAIAKLPNPFDRAKVATELFGRTGQSLLNTLSQGSDAIREQIKEAADLGMAYSRIDAAKVEAANDAWTRVKGVITGVGNALAIEVAPYLEAAARGITEWVKQMGGLGPIIKSAFKFAVEGAAIAGDAIEAFVDTVQLRWLQFRQQMLNTLLVSVRISKGFREGLGLNTDFLDGALEHGNKAMFEILKQIDQAKDRLADQQWGDGIRNAFEAIDAGANRAAEAVAANANNAKNLADNLGAAAKQQKAIEESAKEAMKARESIEKSSMGPLDEFRSAMQELIKARSAGLDLGTGQQFAFDAFQKLKGSLGSGSSQVQFAPAAIAGSSAEKSLIARSSYQPPKDRTVSDILTEVKEMNRARQDEARKFAEEFAATVGVIDF